MQLIWMLAKFAATDLMDGVAEAGKLKVDLLEALIDALKSVDDPRVAGRTKHQLINVLILMRSPWGRPK